MTAFALAGLLEAPTVVLIDAERIFNRSREKIHLPITEFLLRAAVGDLFRSKKLRDWAALNAVLLPPFLTEAVVFERKTQGVDVL